MSLPQKNNNVGIPTDSNEGHNGTDEAAAGKSSDFFADEPSEYIDSTSILPASESREQLNHFFEETTSTTPAENAEILQHEGSTQDKGEPETFGETAVGKFLKNLFSKE